MKSGFKNERDSVLDTFKFLAMFIIYTTHFIAKYNREVFRIWREYPTALLLRGVTGKFGVAIFAVILGYLAYKGGNHSKKSLLIYGTKRYLYFFICALFINTVYTIWKGKSLGELFWATIKIDSSIFSTYWCIQSFFIASVLAYMIGKYEMDIPEILCIIILCAAMGYLWSAICLFGVLYPFLLNSKLFNNSYGNIIWFLIAFILIKRSESTITYIIDGICALIFIIFVEKTDIARKIFSNKATAYLGKNSMSIFLIHPFVYANLGKLLFSYLQFPYKVNFVLVWFVCFVVICIVAVPLNFILNTIFKTISSPLEKLLIWIIGRSKFLFSNEIS